MLVKASDIIEYRPRLLLAEIETKIIKLPAPDFISKTMKDYYYVPVWRHIQHENVQMGPEPSDKTKIDPQQNRVYDALVYNTEHRTKIFGLLEQILGAKLDLSFEGDRHVSIDAKRGPNSVNIVNDGSSIHSLLYVLAQIVSAPKYTVVMIDEPELSLYPAIQKKMFDVVYKYAKENDVQIIMTTHSVHIIQSALDYTDDGVSVLEMTLNDDATNINTLAKEKFLELLQSDFMDWGKNAS